MSARAAVAAALVLALTLTLVRPAAAGDAEGQLWPELNGFMRLGETTRLFLLAAWTRSQESPDVEGQLGVHLDVTLSPLLRPRLREADWERKRYLWMRVGYVLGGTLGAGPDQTLEHRGLVDLTARVPLPAELWLVNRGRVELRDLDGEVSGRFRYRVGVEREVTVRGLTLVPYAQAEVFYDTRFDTWNRQLYQVGVEVALDRHWRIEPYLARQDDTRSSPAHVNAVGLVLKFYY